MTKKIEVQHDLSQAVFWGCLSLLLAFIKFEIPGTEGIASDLREIPLLISIYYLRSPYYLVIACALTAIATPSDGSIPSTFIMHFVALLAMWLFYQFLKTKEVSGGLLGIFWGLGVVAYFMVLLLPIMMWTHRLFGFNENIPPWEFYKMLAQSVSFEMVVAILVTALYLMQYNAQQALKCHLNALEDVIAERTNKLALAMAELNETNQELTLINESLDQRIDTRTNQLATKNAQLKEYAFINSHLLRAPLARVLGLATILSKELQEVSDRELVEKFLKSCQELDEIIKFIGEVLVDDDQLSENELMELKEQIKAITQKFS